MDDHCYPHKTLPRSAVAGAGTSCGGDGCGLPYYRQCGNERHMPTDVVLARARPLVDERNHADTRFTHDLVVYEYENHQG